MDPSECRPDLIFQSRRHFGFHNPAADLRATIKQGLDIVGIEFF